MRKTTPQQPADRIRIAALAPEAEELSDEALEHIAGGMIRQQPGGGTTYLGPDSACWDPYLP